ncbi:non-ribosomal peptide synthase/polyketide synthase [Paenibacillus caseinilyticus]|uniref:non-ribosomal peptide synthase/polyketide synthase n=1 Tax=Paenibacillus mucilaginosus TaxID=61624 RepID=UPI0013E8D926|nr:non-ribosomal peptide synthetase [Paenibacillus mucilaginosus]
MLNTYSRELFPLTQAQQRIWYTEMLYPGTTACLLSATVNIEGPFQPEILKQAIQWAIRHNDAFRIRMTQQDGIPMQYVEPYTYKDIEYVDFSDAQDERQAQQWLYEHNRKPLVFLESDLFRFVILKIKDGYYQYNVQMHHIAADGIGLNLVINQISDYYAAIVNEDPAAADIKRSSYIDYIPADQAYESSERYRKDQAFWLDKFSTLPDLTGLKSYDPFLTSTAAERKTFILDHELFKDIKAFGQQHNVSVFTIFLAALYIYLHKVTNEQDVAVGTNFANRTSKQEKDMVGMFVSTVAARVSVDPEADLLSFLQQVAKEQQSLLRHQKYPYNHLIQNLREKHQNHSIQRLFGIVMEYQVLSFPEVDHLKLLTKPDFCGHEMNDFVIHIKESINENQIDLDVDYRTHVFQESEIEGLIQRLLLTVQFMLRSPHTTIAEISLISEEERRLILTEWADTAAPYPKEKTIHQLFEEQAARTPERTAVTFGSERLTYRELNERANQLAHTLRAKGVQPDGLVGVMAERSLEMIVGIYGILKAGAAYVPIDPSFPEERIRYILEDSGAGQLLLKSHLGSRIPAEFAGELVELDDESVYAENRSTPQGTAGPNHLAYVIYTSGSTGNPKGVMVEHHSVINRLLWMQEAYPLDSSDTIMQKTPVTFDVSVWELFWWALAGAKVHLLPPGGEKDPGLILHTIAEQHITTMHFVPAMLQAFLDHIEHLPEQERAGKLVSLKQVFASGEALTLPQASRFQRFIAPVHGAKLINLYGPTEATVDVSYYECTEDLSGLASVPIGKPISNIQLYITGAGAKELQPIGVPGELCIAGVGVARGYLNRPELTAEKFTDNPFVPGGRMYRTGDLARWLPEGQIEYLGRIDHQVKIRGYRIELGEVEAKVSKIESVREAVVMAREKEDGQKHLCAYFVADRELTVGELRKALSLELPEYMIPSYFIQLAKMPLSPNGKIDRKALPAVEGNVHADAEYAAPRTPVEKALVSVWESVLGMKTVGIHDHFFELGGDSIKAMQVSSRLQQAGYKLDMKHLFTYRTVAELSTFVQPLTRTADQGEVMGETLLIPIQHWFFEQEFAAPHHFNQAFLLYREEGFDEAALRLTVQKIAEHHDALRMVMVLREDGYRARIRSVDEGELYSLETVDLREGAAAETSEPSPIAQAIAEKANEIQSRMDLANGPLLKLGLFRCADGDHLLISIHHMAVDGVSWRILFEDLAAGYEQAVQAQPIRLPAKTDSFRLWSESLAAYADSPAMEAQRAYWQGIEQAHTERLPLDFGGHGLEAPERDHAAGGKLPEQGSETGRPHEPERERPLLRDSDIVTVRWSKEDTERLQKQAHRAYNTDMNDLLLTALGLAIHRWTGLERVLVNLEGHGREPVVPDMDVTRTVGWFTSQFPVLLELDQENTDSPEGLGARIKRVKESLRGIPHKGIGYGILRYLSAPAGTPSAVRLGVEPEISFNYLGQFDQDLESSGLKPSPYSGGADRSERNARPYVLDMNGAVTGGELIMTVSYSTTQYRRESVERLGECFQAALREIIAHCTAQERAELTPSDVLFKGLTVEELDRLQQQTQQIGEIENVYALTPMQKGMWFHRRLDEGSHAYFEQVTFTLNGLLDPDTFRQSLDHLTRRHDALRTNFYSGRGDQPLQVVYRSRKPGFAYEDLRGLQPGERQTQVDARIQGDKARGFDLEQDPLFRVTILRLADKEYQFLWSFHHIVMDGWCLPLMIQEAFDAYAAFGNGSEPALGTAGSYGRYIEWLERQDGEAASGYWKTYLDGYDSQTDLLPAKSQQGQGSADGYTPEKLVSSLGKPLTEGLQRTANRLQVTMNTMIQTAWGVLLQRYNRTDDVVFGSVVSGRSANIPGIETMIGLFINTIPVRVRSGAEETVAGLLRSVQEQSLLSAAYDTYPLYEIQALSGQKQDLIRHLVVFENYPMDQRLGQFQEEKGIVLSGFQAEEQTNYDFNVIVLPGEELTLRLEFNGGVYDREGVERVRGHLVRLLEQFAGRPEARIGELELLTSAEQTDLLEMLDAAAAEYPRGKTIHELFAEQAQRTPDRTAVVYEDRQITYRQLDEQSSRLAVWLREQGVGAETLVGVMLERSVDMIVAMLGTLKAGGAYVPIDIKLPQERIDYIIEDSGIGYLITADALDQAAGFAGTRIDIKHERVSTGPADAPEAVSTSRNLAYIIYTSGTTGRPKGVMVEHNQVVRLMVNDRMPFDFTENDVWTMFHSNCFDFSVWEMYGALLYGGKLVIVPEETTKDFESYLALLKKEHVTVLNQTPGAFYLLMNLAVQDARRDAGHGQPLSLRYVIFGGEALKPALLQDWKRTYPDTRLINMYGITETTVHVTFKEIGLQEIASGISNIGRAIPTLTTYVMDEHLNLLPFGVAGELCVGGDGVARGYLNRAELTQERFLPNPHREGERIYRSGDLVRLLPNGELEYLGRIDHQVKIRGYRIELGEIENRLLGHEEIEDAVVLAKEDKQSLMYLCAYFVSRRELTQADLKAYLKLSLPEYMVPAFFVRLEEFPLTGNGKVNRKALPEPAISSLAAASYEAPRTEAERKLAAIWQAVLDVERVGVDDNFFELGGHSLKATAVVSEIGREFHIRLPLKELLLHPTVREIGAYLERSGAGDAKPSLERIEPCVISETYETSSAQKRLYAVQQREPDSTAYNMPGCFELGPDVQEDRLEAALQALIRRHEALRTSFETADGEIVQRIADDIRFQLEVRQESESDPALVASRFVRPFSLDQAPLFRAELVRSGDKRYLLLDMHHIVTDGLSLRLFLDELLALYEGAVLEPLPIQYKDYAVWHNRFLQSDELKKQEQYWVSQYQDEVPQLRLPYDLERPAVQSFEGGTVILSVAQGTTERLRRLAKERGCTLHMVLLSAFQLLLSRYSGQDDLVVGVPVAGRSRAELQTMMGMFVNTLALRSRPSGDKTYLDYLNEVREYTLEAYENDSYPFDRLVERLALTRDSSRNPLFDVMFDTYTVEAPGRRSPGAGAGGLTLEPRSLDRGMAKFDIEFNVLEQGGALELSVDYAARLFHRETIERMASHYTRILEDIALNGGSDKKLSDIEMLLPEEREVLIHRFNEVAADEPAERLFHEWFEEQADLTPDQTAVVYEEQRLTYGELNARSNRLARTLRQAGVQPNQLVGILADRSVDLLVGVMGVWKAGAAYVPLDPDYPSERIDFMLEDSGAKVLLTQTGLRERAEGWLSGNGHLQAVLCLDDEASYDEASYDEASFAEESANLSPACRPQDLAYVIYTSGTTGRPKGVMIEHRSLMNTASAYRREYRLGEFPVRLLQLASFSFDVFVGDIARTLYNGGTMFICPKDDRIDPVRLYERIRQDGITIFESTPALIVPFMEYVAEQALDMSAMELLITSSDSCSVKDYRLLQERFGSGFRIINAYGVTEATIDSSFYDEPLDKLPAGGSVPIGRAYLNAKFYIVDAFLNPVPVGVLGELCIGGPGVARGYWNRPELTAEKFVDSPFAAGERLYRTGDLARWMPDGNVDFIGRIDHQAKIRGYRVETGEIETVLLKAEEVRAAVVVVRDDAARQKVLCAYVTSDRELDPDLLRSRLAQELPSYMVPSYFIQLAHLPLTANGKVDRKALPEPDFGAMKAADYEAPRSDAEAKLVEVCSEVLGGEPVGIQANFFDLGGDSIKAIRIISKLQKYGYSLEVKHIFGDGALKSIAGHLKRQESAVRQETVTGEAALTPVQRSFFEQELTDPHHYNQSAMLFRSERFDGELVRQVFEEIVSHHDALRMVYREEGGRIVQYNRGVEAFHELFALTVFDYTGRGDCAEEVGARSSELQSSMDLEHGPLVQLGLFRLDEGDHLLIAVHHLVIDGVSWRILLEDFTEGYRQAQEGPAIRFPAKTNSFRDWGAYLQKQVESGALEEEFGYWDRIQQAAIEPLPVDGNSGGKDSRLRDAGELRVEFSLDETDRLLKQIHRAYRTDVQDILLTALGLSVREWTGQDQVLIQLEGHGRQLLEGGIEIGRTVGWFTAEYPVLLEMGASALPQAVKRVKETLRHVPNKGIGYGMLKYLGGGRTEWNRNTPEISFNYLGQFDGELQGDLFEVSRLSAGDNLGPENKMSFALDINGMVVDRKLSFTFAYNTKRHREATIREVADGFKRHVQAIMEHCLALEAPESTPSDFSDPGLTLEELDRLKEQYEAGGRYKIADVYPLSPMQEGMLFHALLDPESAAYFEQTTYTSHGPLDMELVNESFNKLLERYEILRSVIAHKYVERPRQIVLAGRRADVIYEDLTHLDEQQQKAYLEQFERTDRAKRFDLSRDLLIRLSVLKLGDREYRVIWSSHHILTDAWSTGILMKEFFDLYAKLRNHEATDAPKPVPYSRYIQWLEKQNKAKARSYWASCLEGYESAAELPDLSSTGAAAAGAYVLARHDFRMDRTRSERLRKLAQRTQTTMNTVIQAAWGILLQKVNHTPDVVFGSVVSGRNAEVDGIDEMAGLMINTIPVRVRGAADSRFVDLLRQTQRQSLDSASYDYYPLADIQALSELKEKLIHNKITFQNHYVDESFGTGDFLKRLGFRVSDIGGFEQTSFDFNMKVVPGDELEFTFAYNAAVYDQASVVRYQRYFEQILEAVALNEEMPLSHIGMLPQEEKQQILTEFGADADVTAEPQEAGTVVELFEAQARRRPDHPAVVFQQRRLTYRELSERSSRLARVLRSCGVQADTIVGLLAEPSPELVVGILGIMKSGGAYLPIDPGQPQDRIGFMVGDAAAKIVITAGDSEDGLKERLAGYDGTVLALAEGGLSVSVDGSEVMGHDGDSEQLDSLPARDSLAYVIYTSGTTGRSKGVMIAHSSLANYVQAMAAKASITDDDAAALTSSYAFDLGYTSLYTALASGVTLHLLSEDMYKDPDVLVRYVREHCTYLKMTPSLFQLLLQGAGVEQMVEAGRLRLILLGGEPFNAGHLEQFYRMDPGGRVRFMNHYGPTESTIGCAAAPLPREGISSLAGVIGRPLPGSRIYIVDHLGDLCPIGVPGELWVAGAGVARGYLNRPDLTSEKFMENPFVPGERLYRTGDLAKWRADGRIELIGRMDSQVKVRGFRIELGDVEAKLLSHPAVKEAAVVARVNEEKETFLTAYYVGSGGMDAAEVRGYLKESLPPYMVPAYLVPLDVMPLTSNGKIDRRALPEPEFGAAADGDYAAPRTDMEARLAEVWSEVLGTGRVGIRDNFFDLGGHSLKATVLISRIHQRLNMEVPLKEVFRSPTVEAMARYAEGSGQTRFAAIEPCAPQERYETSSAQRRMYLVQALEQGVAYNVPVICEVGSVEPDRIESIFQRLVDRHEALRTSFVSMDGRILQKIEPQLTFKLDYRTVAPSELEAEFQAFIRPFDLGQAPLLRAALVRTDGRTYLWVDRHHIISDGVSSQLLTREITDLYQGRPLEPLRIQYKDYAAWQNKWMESGGMKEQEAYWTGRFQGEIPILTLPYDYERPAVQSFEGSVQTFELDKPAVEGLRKLARETGSTLHMVLLSAFHILLSKYSGQHDIVIGSPVAGRPHADLQNIMGMFVNTLALRNQSEPDQPYREFLQTVKEHALEAYEHQSYPFEELLDKVQVKRDTGRNPLFDVMFIMSYANAVPKDGPALQVVPADSGISKFDLTLEALESGETIRYTLEYASKLFHPDTIARLGRNFAVLLNRLCANPAESISALGVLDEAEQRQLTEEFNATALEFAREQTVHGLIEEQAGRTPERTAVHFGWQSLTYRELNAKANQLARVLRREGVGPDTVVGLMVPRSLEMLVGILGILKAGGAYLPLDPSHPKDRIGYMLEDAQVRLLLTSGGLEGLAGELRFGGALLDVMSEELYQGDDTSLESVNSSRDLAYVLYTSGSTGNPKGVMVEHRQVSNFITAIVEATELTRSDSILCLTTISFDIFGLETLVPLAHGMQVIVGSEEEGSDGTKLAALIRRFGIEAMQSTPSRLKLLLEHAAFREALGGMQRILIGGEELPAALWERLQAYDRLTVYNVYGPTETTIWSTVKRMETGAARLTIGKPIGNTQIYMVDAQDQLTPVGVPGHMCIAGDGVTRGYLGRPELTAEKFVDNPFVPGTRMYKTGDLARWLPSGEIEFLGRMDNQVKIRGYRIELGEIEHRLAGHAAVKEAVVTARTDESGQPYLCAYFVGRSGPVEKGELKGHLKAGLPEYMIPAYFVQLEEIPLTSNGKVNRKALPAPDESALVTGGYEAPQTAVEETLAAIWSRVLGVAQVGIHDSFFDLGGHSLKATLLMSGIHQKLQVEVPLQELFRRPTIRELAGYIETAGARAYEAIEPVEEQAWYEASSAQKRMYALQQLDPQSTAYHMPGVYELEGRVDAGRLERALKGLVQRHEALRTSFAAEDGEIVQRIEREASFGVPARSYGEKPIEAIAADFVKPFELERAPLFRAELAEAGGRTYLLLDMHHIISDGVSMGILVKDFVRLYNGEELEPLRIQYKDYAAWHNRRLKEGELAKQEAYWTAQFEDGVPVLRLPYDYERPALQSFEGERLHFTLGGEATQGLRVLAKEQEATMPMVLMSVFTILLSKYSGQEDIVVGTPVAGRPHADLQEMVGMFVNTLALRSRPAGGKTYRAYLQEVKMSSLQAYDHQSYPLEQLAEKLGTRRDLSRNPLFDVMLDMSGLEETDGIALDDTALHPYRVENPVSKFDLTLKAYETESAIELTFEYATALFKKETMERTAGHLLRLIDEILGNPDVELKHLTVLSEAEEAKLSDLEEELNRLKTTAFSF